MAETDQTPAVRVISARRSALVAMLVGALLLASAVLVNLRQHDGAAAVAGASPTDDAEGAGGARDPGRPTEPADPPPGGTPPAALVVPEGAIDLREATIELPALPENVTACQGRRTFSGAFARGTAPAATATPPGTTGDARGHDAMLRIEAEWAGQVDGDGALETLALVGCDIVDTAHNWQLIALAPGAAGEVRTIGQILASGPAPAPAILFGLKIADGAVTTDIGDFLGDGDANAAKLSGRQARTYRLTAGAFRQIAGPVAFAPNPNFYDLAVAAGSLTFAAPVAGSRAGTLAVTVRNAGPAAASDVSLVLSVPAIAEPTGARWADCGDTAAGGTMRVVACPLGTVDAGQQRTITYEFRVTANPEPSPALPAFVQVSGTDHLGLGYALDQSDANDVSAVTVVVS